MKIFRITTQMQATQTVQYIVEAETEQEALIQIISGAERGEGETIEDEIDWSTEIITAVKFIEEDTFRF
jgi:hypothetical protein